MRFPEVHPSALHPFGRTEYKLVIVNTRWNKERWPWRRYQASSASSPFSLGRGDNFRVDGLTDDLVTQSCVRVVGGPGPAAAHECD